MKHIVFLIILLFINLNAFGENNLSLADWINIQRPRALLRLRNAIHPSDGSPGSVFASPSRFYPNYYFHWVRDAAIALREIYELRSSDPEIADQLLKDFAHFSRKNQLTENFSGGPGSLGLGEPKFYLDGSPFLQPWGRPQNDGPALRTFVFARFAQDLWREGRYSEILEQFYRAELPAKTILKADLEYIAHHWKDASFDLWEEILGDHFYTRMIQWKALEEGAKVARLMQDHVAAVFYEHQAQAIRNSLQQFWSPQKQILKATLHIQNADSRASEIDTAIILAVIQVGSQSGAFSISDKRVLNTAFAIEKTFIPLYKINRILRTNTKENLGPAIGRYPEDHYDGYFSNQTGNPWILTTLALSEFYYRLAKNTAASSRKASEQKIATFLQEKGDSFLRRIQFHTDKNGHFSEQINRDSGIQQGAFDLTWSYAAFLSCLRARDEIISLQTKRK